MYAGVSFLYLLRASEVFALEPDPVAAIVSPTSKAKAKDLFESAIRVYMAEGDVCYIPVGWIGLPVAVPELVSGKRCLHRPVSFRWQAEGGEQRVILSDFDLTGLPCLISTPQVLHTGFLPGFASPSRCSNQAPGVQSACLAGEDFEGLQAC